MQRKQPKHEALKCTYKKCQRLQTEGGEFCETHFLMLERSAQYIQNFGEQHPSFNSAEMKKWRKARN